MMSAEKRAGELFDMGHSCTRSVLQATGGSNNQELLAATAGFSCGIGKSGCLCGAITGGVMALGLNWRADRSADLMAAFKDALHFPRHNFWINHLLPWLIQKLCLGK